MSFQKVRIVQDDDCHWYVIPNELLEEFRKDEMNEELIDSGKFDEKYDKFRTGYLNLVQLYVKI